MNTRFLQTVAILVFCVGNSRADVHFVNVNNSSPVAPYTSWATAAAVIQDAVDVVADGDEIIVTNGVYRVGGRAFVSSVGGMLTNRARITNAIVLKSVNGPAVTTIEGQQTPETINAFESVRCVYLGAGATLSGFTITNGSTQIGADDGIYESYGGGIYCAASNSIVTNCIIINNSAGDGGGGVFGGTVNNSHLIGNTTTLWGYSAGGGAEFATLNNCALSENVADGGGGVYYSTLNNCTLTGNSAGTGGGSADCTLNNCIIYFNTAPAGPNWADWFAPSTLNFCCTTPRPLAITGTNNIDSPPILASASHLTAASPCRGAGSALFANGVDIDRESWASPPSIGCDEFNTNEGPLIVGIHADRTNVVHGFTVNLASRIFGSTFASDWDLGDGTLLTNQPFVAHAWAVPGDYPVVLRAYSANYPGGLATTQVVHVVEGIYYVAANNATPVAPYNSWSTAATNIQDAVDEALLTGTVLVSNGVYQAGGRTVWGALTNRVAVRKVIAVRSVNGPAATVIEGYQVPGPLNGDRAVRCVYLGSGATLSGFTITNGATQWNTNDSGDYGVFRGGGVFCETANEVVSNCVVVGCVASDFGGGADGGTIYRTLLVSNSCNSGGGVAEATLYNCELSGNRAGTYGGGAIYSTLAGGSLHGNSAAFGGGAWSCTLGNCTLIGNSSAFQAGGAGYSDLRNSILYFNSCDTGPNYLGGSFDHCCTTPLPDSGTGNITTSPVMADYSHLSALSPCLGAGSALFVSGRDLDGEAWLNPPSIGCDELHAGGITGPLLVTLFSDYASVFPGFDIAFAVGIEGHASSNRWQFDDGASFANQLFVTHHWADAGDHTVVFTAFNETYPGGISATATVHIVEQILYAAVNGTNPVAPYASWATAATNIQDAVDAATIPGALVLVGDGVYSLGGRLAADTTNRVTIDKPLTVLSANGPAAATIKGYRPPGDVITNGPIRCAYVTNRAVLSGFTLTNGAANTGGGVFCEFGAIVSNCVFTANYADGYGGGGVYGGTLNNCLLIGNSTGAQGGGAMASVLNNCALRDNTGTYGGGAEFSTLTGCTLSNNTAVYGGGADSSTMVNCSVLHNGANIGGGIFRSTLTGCALSFNWTANGTEGAATGGGASSSTLTNCVLSFNTATNGGGASTCFLYDCSLSNNSARAYGGAADSTVGYFCLVSENWATNGGAASSCDFHNSTFSGNSAYLGGGDYGGTLNQCVLLGNSSVLRGGGAAFSTVYNCVLNGNTCYFYGGGAGSCYVYNSLFVSNSATAGAGGGADNGELNNCTVAYNSTAGYGGGVKNATVRNSIVYFNTAGAGDNSDTSTFVYSCTIPATSGTANFTNAPLFVNASAGNFRLQANSLCINSGHNAYAPESPDLDGNPRIAGGQVDVGVYEFQSPTSIISYLWLQQHGLPNDGSADHADPDGDDFENWQEALAGTSPTDPASVLRILSIIDSPPGRVITWQTVPGVIYFLDRTADFGSYPNFDTIAGGLLTDTNTISIIDYGSHDLSAAFYRVGVEH